MLGSFTLSKLNILPFIISLLNSKDKGKKSTIYGPDFVDFPITASKNTVCIAKTLSTRYCATLEGTTKLSSFFLLVNKQRLQLDTS